MIGYLSGQLMDVGEQHVIVDVNGVGYEVYSGKQACFDVPKPGSKIALWIHTYVREDQIALFGFRSAQQRRLFLMVTAISGVGPKLGYALLAQFDEGTLVRGIVTGDTNLIKTVPGIGKKMAERVVLELKEKLGGLAALTDNHGYLDSPSQSSQWSELAEALIGLGFADERVRNVIRLLRSDGHDDLPLDQLLKKALQKIHSC